MFGGRDLCISKISAQRPFSNNFIYNLSLNENFGEDANVDIVRSHDI